MSSILGARAVHRDVLVQSCPSPQFNWFRQCEWAPLCTHKIVAAEGQIDTIHIADSPAVQFNGSYLQCSPLHPLRPRYPGRIADKILFVRRHEAEPEAIRKQGADGRNLRGMVLQQVGRMLLVGGVIGIGAALLLGRAAASLLFELEGNDPVVLVVTTVLLAFVALGAGYLPALRASRVDPMKALRFE